MDRSGLRKKVLLDLLTSPWTLVPAAVGLSSFIVGWALSQGLALFPLLGFGGLLAGVGSFFTQWILRGDDVTRKAYKELEQEAVAEREAELDDLDRRLQRDKDPRTEQTLRELRDVYSGFKGDRTWSEQLDAKAAFEIASRVERLFRECVHSLGRSYELWETAEKMRTEGFREKVLNEREQLLDEISQSLSQLAGTIDNVRALALKKGETEKLNRIRHELDESLEVAKRVEERMRGLEADLGQAIASPSSSSSSTRE